MTASPRPPAPTGDAALLEVRGLSRSFRGLKALSDYELALRAGWDRLHPALGITEPFYDRFTPAISTRDFALRDAQLERALDFVAVVR